MQLYNIADFSFIKIWNSCQLNQFDQICIERKIIRSPRVIYFEKSININIIALTSRRIFNIYTCINSIFFFLIQLKLLRINFWAYKSFHELLIKYPFFKKKSNYILLLLINSFLDIECIIYSKKKIINWGFFLKIIKIFIKKKYISRYISIK